MRIDEKSAEDPLPFICNLNAALHDMIDNEFGFCVLLIVRWPQLKVLNLELRDAMQFNMDRPLNFDIMIKLPKDKKAEGLKYLFYIPQNIYNPFKTTFEEWEQREVTKMDEVLFEDFIRDLIYHFNAVWGRALKHIRLLYIPNGQRMENYTDILYTTIFNGIHTVVTNFRNVKIASISI